MLNLPVHKDIVILDSSYAGSRPYFYCSHGLLKLKVIRLLESGKKFLAIKVGVKKHPLDEYPRLIVTDKDSELLFKEGAIYVADNPIPYHITPRPVSIISTGFTDSNSYIYEAYFL